MQARHAGRRAGEARNGGIGAVCGAGVGGAADGGALRGVGGAQRRGAGRGLQSSTFQLNLSRFLHKIHTEHPLIPSNTPSTPHTEFLNETPIQQKALAFSRKADECKPLGAGA